MSSKLVEITDYDPINLLTQNEVYLNAVQKASISVYTLGFKPLVQNTIHRRDGLLNAVVPRLDQGPFLDRVDAGVHSYIKQKRKQDQKSRMRCSMDPNSDVMKQLAQFQLQHAETGENDDGQSKKSGKKKKILKVNPNDEIRAARPTTRMEKEREEKKKQEEEEKKKAYHKDRISKRYPLLEDGVEMVYDDNGNKVPLHVFEKQRSDRQKEEESKKKRQADEAKREKNEEMARSLSSQRELWMKSSTHVERLRQQAITQRKEYPFWSPGSLPASTLTMAKEKTALPTLLVFQKFPKTGEYDAAVHSMLPGDIFITIEHCDHCHHHDEFTHHQSKQYAEMAKLVIQALRETAERYALRFFSLVRGIDEIDALELSRSHAVSAAIQAEDFKIHMSAPSSSNLLYLKGPHSPGNTNHSRSSSPTPLPDSKDAIALEDQAIEQTLGKLRRSLSFRSFNVAASDFQAIRNEAKVQVLQSHNKHRIGAFEVQVTLCIGDMDTPLQGSKEEEEENGFGSSPSSRAVSFKSENASLASPQHHHQNSSSSQQRPVSAPPTTTTTTSSSSSTNLLSPSSSAHSLHSANRSPQQKPQRKRQLIQHVLYSKLYHGAWPSVMKLRERLEVLLDTHGVTRVIAGSTVRSHTTNGGNSNTTNNNNPVLMGPLSQMSHHCWENARKVETLQKQMRSHRHAHKRRSPTEELQQDGMDWVAAEQDLAADEAAAASQWQEKEWKKYTPLQNLIVPAFDNRTMPEAHPKLHNRHQQQQQQQQQQNHRPVSADDKNATSRHSNNNKTPSPRRSSSSSSSSSSSANNNNSKSPTNSSTSTTTTAAAAAQKSTNTGTSHSSNSGQSPQHHHHQMPPPLLVTEQVSLSEEEIYEMDDDILKSMRAADSNSQKGHDWSENADLDRPASSSQGKNNAVSPKKSALASSSNHNNNNNNTHVSDANVTSLNSSGKTKTVSFSSEVDHQDPATNTSAPATATAETSNSSSNNNNSSSSSSTNNSKKADTSTVGKKTINSNSSSSGVSAPRPTLVKPALRSQPSLKDFVRGNDTATDDGDDDEENGITPPDTGNSGTGGENSNNPNNNSSASLYDHFKQNDTNTLRAALASIQRMLSNDDDSAEENRSIAHHGYLDDHDEHHPHHPHHPFTRADTFADDPFFQQLEHGESMLRISVNLGDDAHDGEDDDGIVRTGSNGSNGGNSSGLRGGEQIAVTKILKSPTAKQ